MADFQAMADSLVVGCGGWGGPTALEMYLRWMGWALALGAGLALPRLLAHGMGAAARAVDEVVARWRLATAPACGATSELCQGQWVRLSGRVEGRPTVASPYRRQAAVLWSASLRSRLGVLLDRAVDGGDFMLRLDDGQRIRVLASQAVRAARLRCWRVGRRWRQRLGRGPDQARFAEAVVAVGDRVEVCGQAQWIVDAEGDHGPRGTPGLWTLAAGRHGLIVR